ncbi:MAG TPA: hypothetical protein PK156_06250 [Polyangium sp.]|nr:hypothetical protein [Polyangium sp.]
MFIHPALNLPLVRLSALLERANPSVTKLLEDTAVIAHQRIRRDSELRQAVTQLDTPPFGSPPRSIYSLPEHVTQRDLLIAMLASDEHIYREMLYAGVPPNPDGYQEPVAHARLQYSSMMEMKTHPGFDLSAAFERTLELPWSARHALDWSAGNDTPLTVDSLVNALEPRAWMALAEYVPDYVEGLVTAAEAAAWLVRPYQERLAPAFGSIYIDLHGQMESLRRLLLNSPTVWLTGTIGSGRNALASAWMAEQSYQSSREGSLKGIRSGLAWHGLGSAPDNDALGPAHGIGLDAIIHLMVCPDDGSRHGPATTRVGEVNLTGGSGALEKLTPTELLAILQTTMVRPNAARALLVSSSEERAIICNVVPEAAKISVIDVPPLTEVDQLLLWLAKIPSVRLPGGALAHVSTMVDAFAAAPEAERRERSVKTIDRALLRGRVSMGDGAERITDALARVRRGRALRTLDVQSVQRFLGSEERLHGLAAFAPQWDALT